jgi:hypothetical protein
MPTPLRRRFRVDTLLLDKTAPVAVLNVAALITKSDGLFTGGARWISVFEDDFSETVPAGTYPVEHKWLDTYFGQELKPDVALLVLLDDDATPAELGANIDQAVAQNAAWYQLHYVGKAAADIDMQLAIANYNQSFEEKTQAMLLTNDINAYATLASSDIGFKVRSTSQERTAVIYHPLSTRGLDGATIDTSAERPDAGAAGRMLSTDAGSQQWDWKALIGVTDSGLSQAQQNALRAKGYNFVEQIKNTAFVHVFPGRLCTDREIRIQWGADWFDVNVQASLANYAFRTPLMAFDQDTFADVEAILYNWGARAETRRIIKPGSFVVTLPDPDTIPASVRASGIANFNNVYDAELNSAIDQWRLQGTWKIGGV